MKYEFKRLLFVLLFVLFVFETAFCITMADDHLVNRPINFVSVPKTDTSPKLDGNLDDVCWQKVAENSPARAVVHWRYALSDPHYKIYMNEWVDEYYTLYPDGVGIREINLWPNSSTLHEMFEVLLVKPPGVQTEQLFEDEFATLSNLEGEGYSNKYYYKNRDFYYEFVKKSKGIIVEVHYEERMHPFTVFSLREDLLPNVTPDPIHVSVCRNIAEVADRRGHWPAARYQADGYNTVGLDVPHHGNIGGVRADTDPELQPMTWKYLIGVADKGRKKPEQSAKSWLYPGKLEMVNKDFLFEGYDYSQRAYVIHANKSSKRCEMKFLSEQNNIMNPVFIIENTGKAVKQVRIDNNPISDQTYRIGRDKNNQIVLFVEQEIEDLESVVIEFE